MLKKYEIYVKFKLEINLFSMEFYFLPRFFFVNIYIH